MIKYILTSINATFDYVGKANAIKDRWLQSRIRQYANDVRRRYPNRLTIIEKIVSPVIVQNYAGTVANLISIIRILLAIIVTLILIIYKNNSEILLIFGAFIIFIIAGILDLLDGPTARALNEVSESGKILDPLADKILLASVIVIMGYLYLPSVTYIAILGLEIFLMIISLLKIAAKSLPFTMCSQANMAGKIKNIFELTAGAFLFLCPVKIIFADIANMLFVLAIPLAVGSIAGYLMSIKKIK